ncbi:MAG: phosphoglycerate dehydrogenase [Thermaerobacter sp.]
MPRPHVVVTEPLPRESMKPLEAVADVTYLERLLPPEELYPLIREADALITRSGTRVDRDLLDAAPRVRVVGRAGVGVDNIDLDAATERGVIVVNVAGGNAVAVAEHVFGTLLALLRKLREADGSVRAGEWKRSRFVGDELRGKVLGIVGLGRIGGEVATRARAFRMRIIACDPYIPASRFEAFEAEPVDFDRLLEQADIVTIHTPLTDETRYMFDDRALGRMKPGAYLVNCARGAIVDEAALARALREGRLAGAVVDVYEQEPPGRTPLAELPNVLLTPHIAGSTREALDAIAHSIAEQVAAALEGRPVAGAVNLPSLSDEDWRTVAPLMPAAELAGLVYRDGLGGPLDDLELQLRARTLPSPRAMELLAGAALKGLLEGVVESPVNVVNARMVAERRGLRVRLTTATDPEASLPALRLSGGRDRRRVVGAAAAPDGGCRLTELDGLPLDMAPAAYMLLTRHHDRPGMIGLVGSLLGQHGVNIAAMQVARRQVRGEAIMVLSVDDPVSDQVLAEIRANPGIAEARVVVIPERLRGLNGAGRGAAEGVAAGAPEAAAAGEAEGRGGA